MGISVVRHMLKDTHIDALSDGGHCLSIKKFPIRLQYPLGIFALSTGSYRSFTMKRSSILIFQSVEFYEFRTILLGKSLTPPSMLEPHALIPICRETNRYFTRKEHVEMHNSATQEEVHTYLMWKP